VIPPDFSRNVLSGADSDVQVLLGGMNANTANAARGYATTIVAGYAHDAMVAQAQRAGFTANLPEVKLEQRIWYNPELQFRYFNVISMIVVAGLMVGLVTAAAGLVREREAGTMEQLVVTPLGSLELILAKATPPLLLGLVLLAPSFGVVAWFGVPVVGSVALFVAVAALAFVAFLSLGFLIGALARNLQQALLLSFFALFPLMFLSGTVAPIESMAPVMRALSYISPVRYYMEAALGIFLKGNGIAILWPQMAILGFMALTLGTFAVARLRRELYR
jgi:ABC-2 type transport system permease protein